MVNQITFISGPMFAGKTTFIAEKSREYNSAVIVSPIIDTRQDDTNILWTHACRVELSENIHMKRINPRDLCMLFTPGCQHYRETRWSDDRKYEAIFVTEAQFFADQLELFIGRAVRCKEPLDIYCEGLTYDANGNVFGNMLSCLEKHRDEIQHIKLQAHCTECGNPADWTVFRTMNHNDEQIQIGGEETYMPACTQCANEHWRSE